MLRHKRIDRICCAVLVATLLLTFGLMGAAAAGLIEGQRSTGYERRLFDQSRVHTIDIVMNDWAGFLETCTAEEYSVCDLVIDGEKFGSAAIRGKGNTSLSSVASYGNDRYSFKIEFDHYQTGKTYHGLDKLSLNNLIQDKTYMKDYMAYTLMRKMGVAAPLCSFVQINVNGEAWGLYLAVEGVEDSFLARNYGNDPGELYKPDSLSFGGGRGNGREFDMEAFSEQFGETEAFVPAQMGNFRPMANGMGGMPQMPEGFDPSQMQRGEERGFDGMGGMGAADVMLQYSDDDPESYANIFGNAKTDVTEEDKLRLIASLKALSEGEKIETVVDTDAVIRYLVVHNFLCNDDSYTGSMVHNYYLYEEDGVLSMIPWDYNLAFGAFGMGRSGGSSGATDVVNSPIDSPVSSGDLSSRPIISWILDSEEYTARYHELYAQFVDMLQTDGWLEGEIARVSDMIAPYVEAENRAFFTYDEFVTAADTLAEFCKLRLGSISGQLAGEIPSTADGQRADSASLIDASGMDLNAMGDFNHGGGNMGGKEFGGMGQMRQMTFGAGVPERPGNEGFAQQAGELPEMMNGFPGGMPQQMTPPVQPMTPGEAIPGQQAQQSLPSGDSGQTDAGRTPAQAENAMRMEPNFAGDVEARIVLLIVSVAALAAATAFAGLFKVNR